MTTPLLQMCIRDRIMTPELTHAAKVVLEHRGDGATGWSMGWKLHQWARLQDGNHAYKLFGNLLKNGTLDNLWDCLLYTSQIIPTDTIF